VQHRNVHIVQVATSNGKRYVTIWRPSVSASVCPVGILAVTHQVSACDAASIHFVPIIRRTDILVLLCNMKWHLNLETRIKSS